MEAWLLPGDKNEKYLDQISCLKLPVPSPRKTVTILPLEVGEGTILGPLRGPLAQVEGGASISPQPFPPLEMDS